MGDSMDERMKLYKEWWADFVAKNSRIPVAIEIWDGCWNAKQPVEIPYRLAEYKEALGEIMHACKKQMNKSVGEPWRVLDKINRIASKQMLMMNTPLNKD